MKQRHDGYNLVKWQGAWFGPAHEKKDYKYINLKWKSYGCGLVLPNKW